MFELKCYQEGGQIPFSEWLDELDARTAGRIRAYTERMRSENFGDTKNVGRGVLELKLNFGPGYRVYYLRDGVSVVLLLCGGDKGSQEKDIQQAHNFAQNYWRQREKK
ncbi:MAG: type II toxin-antitoxin system RelE/ParE family toxin [Deltaproteobacteria bacterium]|nr:MAG: type II toxin-antitoxin system RelE/ParE family toxin [Deltaproteobacteria bacterium]